MRRGQHDVGNARTRLRRPGGVELDRLSRHVRTADGPSGLVLGWAGPARAELDRAPEVVGRVLVEHRLRDAGPAVGPLP